VDLDVNIFNAIHLTILRWLWFQFLSWGHDFQACTAMVSDCLIVGIV
jgi:hypothetical protein